MRPYPVFTFNTRAASPTETTHRFRVQPFGPARGQKRPIRIQRSRIQQDPAFLDSALVCAFLDSAFLERAFPECALNVEAIRP